MIASRKCEKSPIVTEGIFNRGDGGGVMLNDSLRGFNNQIDVSELIICSEENVLKIEGRFGTARITVPWKN